MATEQIEESGPVEPKTETISVVVNNLSAERIKLLNQQKKTIELQLETIANTLFEAEGHQVPFNAQLSFSEGFKKISFVKNVEQNPK